MDIRANSVPQGPSALHAFRLGRARGPVPTVSTCVSTKNEN